MDSRRIDAGNTKNKLTNNKTMKTTKTIKIYPKITLSLAQQKCSKCAMPISLSLLGGLMKLNIMYTTLETDQILTLANSSLKLTPQFRLLSKDACLFCLLQLLLDAGTELAACVRHKAQQKQQTQHTQDAENPD